jgi:hypothetical protein
MLRTTALLLCVLATPATLAADAAVTLRGSPESMIRQHGVAREAKYTFHRTPDQIQRALESGTLVPLEGNADYQVLSGATAAARPEVKRFVEQLAKLFRDTCGYPMVVTSLTRAATRQPPNAHPLSVHPAGMAVDLRVPATADCRAWLDRTLLAMERDGVIDATREQRPPHYHVAVFPRPYLAYLAEQMRIKDAAPAVTDATEAFTSPASYPAIAPVTAAQTSSAAAPEGDAEPQPRGWITRLVSRVMGLFRSA